MTTTKDRNEFFISGPEAKLSDRILDAIHHSPSLSESDIEVATTGAAVVLSGTVRIGLQKRLATVIARRFDFLQVRNEIVVTRMATAT